MAGLGDVMAIFFQLIICFVLLLFTELTTPKMQSIIGLSTYFFIFFVIFKTLLIPFMQQFLMVFQPFMHPLFVLTIESAMYFLIATVICDQFEQAGYTSFGKLTMLTVKIMILSLWLVELRDLIQALAQLKL